MTGGADGPSRASEVGGPPLTDQKDFVVDLGALQIVMKPIPAGMFTMGGRQYGTMRVEISRAFWMQQTEMSDEMHQVIAGANGGSKKPRIANWTDAMAIASKLNVREAARLPKGYEFRLPTEAEWEYSARAGQTSDISGTGKIDDMGWYVGNSGGATHDVGTKMANQWGLKDMHGNVWEWNFDWVVTGSQSKGYPPTTATLVDPVHFQPGPAHPYRGGGYHLPEAACGATRRDGNAPGTRSSHLGYRLALAPVLPEKAP